MVVHLERHVNENSDSDHRNKPLSPFDIALYLGYNLKSDEDLRRLSKNVDWVDAHREHDERKAAMRPPFIVGVGVAIITGIFTIGITWLMHIYKL